MAMALIQYQKGDIFESKAQVIVNTVNCKGVMGKGLASAFKERYPDMFAVYQQECKSGKLRIGRPTLYCRSTPWILNFPTKDHWRFPSKIEYLEKGLQFIVSNYKKAGIKSIAFPKLGAQNGKLSWNEVGPLMVDYLSQLDIDVYIYIAEGDREYQYDPLQDSKAKERIWKQFSELALSIDRLCQEVGLSLREAKRVADWREKMEFKSQADIDSIEKLAKASSKKIKDHINRQKHTPTELPGLPSANSPHQHAANGSAKSPKRKKPNSTLEAPVESLFPEKELIHN
jgi:O-acetyl-ADP-ribose deacetylase (regulator of RNase III)